MQCPSLNLLANPAPTCSVLKEARNVLIPTVAAQVQYEGFGASVLGLVF